MHFETGETPLIRAARKGKLELVKLLIEKGANVEAKNKAGMLVALSCAPPRCDCVLPRWQRARRSGVIRHKLVLGFSIVS